MIKNIIFDLGNVLIHFQPEVYITQKGLHEAYHDLIMNEIFKSEEWVQLDRGTITRAQAKEIITARNKQAETVINEFMDDYHNMLNPIENNIKVLDILKEKGYHLYFLSNFHDEAYQQLLERNKFFQLFDGGIISSHEKLLKPEEEIYFKLAEKYHILPEESFFIDDTKANVEMAEKLGFKIIHLENPDRLVNTLQEVDLI